MSKGLGKTQLKVLEHLQTIGASPVFDITSFVYGVDKPSATQLSATRRAIHILEQKNLIGCAEMQWEARDKKRFSWNHRQPVLVAWLPGNMPTEPSIDPLSIKRFEELILEMLTDIPEGLKWAKLGDHAVWKTQLGGIGDYVIDRALTEFGNREEQRQRAKYTPNRFRVAYSRALANLIKRNAIVTWKVHDPFYRMARWAVALSK